MGQLTPKMRSAAGDIRSGPRIFAALKAQIADGTLAAGKAMPSTRALAAELGVSRTTITVVYEQLAAEGYIETLPGRRARVAAGLARRSGPGLASKALPVTVPKLSRYGHTAAGLDLPSPPKAIADASGVDFLYGALSSEDFPTLAWRRAYDRALRLRQDRLYYAASQGEEDLRTEITGYLRRARGIHCTPEQVLVVHGSQQAIDLCSRLLVDPGDRVVLEEPCYLMARRAFEAGGASVCAVPVDEQGLLTEALPKEPCALAYVTPSHQFPLGGVMPIGRRRELLSWAHAGGVWILEDDYDGEFRYGLPPVATLQSIDEGGCVIYVGTFSKALSPQLRMGYLVLPGSLIEAFRKAKQIADRHSPTLEQMALADLIRSGAYEQHIRRVRRKHERRRNLLLRAIHEHLPAGTRVEGAASGLHVVVWLQDVPMREASALAARARAHSLGIWPITPTYAMGSTHRRLDCAGFVFGYASLELAEIESGVKRLAALLI